MTKTCLSGSPSVLTCPETSLLLRCDVRGAQVHISEQSFDWQTHLNQLSAAFHCTSTNTLTVGKLTEISLLT